MSAGAQAWAKGLEDLGQDARRGDRRAGGEPTERKDRRFAAPEWRENPIFDTIRTDLSADLRPAARHGRRDRGRRPGDAREAALRDAQLRRRDEPVELRADQSAGAEADARDARREPAQGPRQHAQRHCAGAADADQARRVRGRAQPRDDAGQGDQADAALPADPVHADDGRGAEDAGRDLPAVDQPLLHPRPQRPRKASSNGASTTASPCSWSAGSRRTRASPTRRSTIMCSTGRSTRSTPSATCSASSVHAIGYCVAGTTLRGDARLPSRARARQDKVKSATFFTAQVDFTEAGDLKLFTGAETMALLEQLTKEKGYLDGRYMAATFNLLRGRDLIWNYVVNNYLLGEEPPPFDLLYWNSDTTNLPAGWHRDYLEDALQGEQACREGRDQGCRNADRHRRGEDADLRPGRARGSYRAAAERVEDHGPFRGPEAVRARRLGPHRRAW